MTLVVTDSLLMKELELEEKPPCWFVLESLNILEDRPRMPMPSHSVITGVLRVLSPILFPVDLLKVPELKLLVALLRSIIPEKSPLLREGLL